MINLRSQLSTPKRASSSLKAKTLKAKVLKKSSALLLGLSMAATLGLSTTASAVTLSDLFLPPSAGYRNASGAIQTVPMNVDGNRVEVFYVDIAEGRTEFCLELGNDVSWWKGLKVFSDNNALLGFIARTGEARSRQCDAFDTADLSTGDGVAKIEIWKAKTFGVHTHVDTLNIDPALVDGKRIIFWWKTE